MMDALISGRAARAVFIQGATVRFIEADDPQTVKVSSLSTVPILLQGAMDIVRIKVKDFTDSYPVLLSNWQKDRALRMVQIVLAADDDEELIEAADYLNDLLEVDAVREYVTSVAYALPHQGAEGFSQLRTLEDFPRAHELINRLVEDLSVVE